MDKIKRKISKQQCLLDKLHKRIDNQVFTSNDFTKTLHPNQFIFRLNKNSFEIWAKNKSDTVLFTSLPITPISNLSTVEAHLNTQRYTVAPYKVCYVDQPSSWWPPESIAQTLYQMVDAGFNIINLAFMVDGVALDMAGVWAGDLKPLQNDILTYAHRHGCSILLSTGGATENDFATVDPLVYANRVADFVLANNLDGVDFDLENFSPGFIAPGLATTDATIQWLVTVTNQVRSRLGPFAIITHAPQAPYFGQIGNSSSWTGAQGGYTAVYINTVNTGNIDFFNVQYYNQGNDNYINYNTIFINSGLSFPGSAVTQLSTWIPINKFILSKPMQPSDASTGYNTPTLINQIMIQAKTSIGWSNAGIMTWQWPYNLPNALTFAQDWLNTVTLGY